MVLERTTMMRKREMLKGRKKILADLFFHWRFKFETPCIKRVVPSLAENTSRETRFVLSGYFLIREEDQKAARSLGW